MTGTDLRPAPASGGGPPRAAAPGSHLRRDIQGLRAVAVLTVIANHLWGWPDGGFVGVDVFFVISGFMITGLLLREQERTGRISFTDFYRRRAKRLLPAAVTVLATTVVLAHQVFTETRFRETLDDAVAAFFFAGNWHFASKETDYFQADGPVSPVQHYWSLAVEEQFYVVWPVLLLVAAFLVRRLRLKRVAGTAAVLGVVVVGSLVWGLAETSSNPGLAYFSTFSRAWELGIGALVALWASRPHSSFPEHLRTPVSMLGLAGIVASLFLISESSTFPAPWALLPVLSTALVLVAGHRGPQTRTGVLSNPAMVTIGDLSYSLYLWHFPVIIFAGEYYDLDAPQASIAALVVIALVSYFSYHLLEDPVRRSGWLEPRAKRAQRTSVITPAYARRAVAGAVIAAVGLTLFVLRPSDELEPTAIEPGVIGAVPGATTVAEGSAQRALQAEIDQALLATDWPELTPPLDEVIAGSWISQSDRDCGDEGPVPASCAWGSDAAPRKAVIVGDSIALSYVQALRTVFAGHPDWKLYSQASFGCTFTDTRTRVSGVANTERCPAEKQETLDALAELQPDLVIVTNRYGKRTDFEKNRFMTPAEWRASQQKMAERIAGDVGRIVYLAPPPADLDIEKCFNKVNKPPNCVSRVTQEWIDVAAVEAGIADRLDGGVWVDTRRLFCDDEGVCPAFVGDVATKPDGVHVAGAYGTKIAPALDELLQELGVL